uniref:DUF4445 domain-containing protein n=1 Tax=Thermofilum pendens TaxID=2269 RepID=A0A7J3X6C5_THEPE
MAAKQSEVLHTLVVEPYGLKVAARHGETILSAFRRSGVPIRSECGGRGLCGKCRVALWEGAAVTLPTRQEERLLGGEFLARGYRLACQAAALGDLKVYVPPESRSVLLQVASRGSARAVRLRPLASRVRVELQPPSLRDVLADWERLKQSVEARTGRSVRIDPELLLRLPARLRELGWGVDAVLWRGELVVDVAEPKEGEGYGLAVDIGTSKVVVHLVDLHTGETVAEATAENPQVFVGEDIVARMTYALREQEGLAELKRLVVDAVNNLAAAVTSSGGVSASDVLAAVLVGNTVMHHLALGIDVRGLAASPFVPAVQGTVDVPASLIGLRYGRRALFPPVIAGYVGSDAVADLVATGMHEEREPAMLLDIGTNTEVILSTGEELLACSAPSGPAFEGGHLRFGMKAAAGAVDRVEIRGGGIRYSVIGGTKPLGLCGSAYIDFAAEALRAGILDSRGFFKRDLSDARLRRGEAAYEYVVVPADESASGHDITVSERDLSELRLAKAAVYAAAMVLLEEAGLEPGDLGRVYVAGSFGYGLNVENAIRIGLLPPVDPSAVLQVGNTAVEGARLMLVSEDALREAEKIAGATRYIELTAAESFPRHFRRGLRFP